MRFYNKYDGPRRILETKYLLMGREFKLSFLQCLIPDGYPPASLWRGGGTLIGALGSVVTHFYN